MENANNVVVVKKSSNLVKALKILLALAAIAFVAAKIYQKFFKKKELPAAESEDTPVVSDGNTDTAEEEQPAEEAFEVSADDVIANADELTEDSTPVTEA